MTPHVCDANKTELEDPQDLRAEIGKCPYSTNERKQMSTKTMKQRIALVAVAALGAGVLSVAPASAAANPAIGVTNAVTAAGILNVATVNSITGAVALAASGSGVATTSLGLLAVSTTQLAGQLTSTATVRADGSIAFYWTATAADKALTIVTDNATVTGASVAAGAINYDVSRKQVVMGNSAAQAALIANFAVTPSAGAATFTVSAYESATTAAALAVGDLASIQAGTLSRGTLVQRYTVTVAATSLSGLYSASNSTVAFTAADGDPATVDVANANTTTAGGSLFLNVQLKDAYAVPLSTTLGALVATVSAGATVALSANANAVTTAGTFTQAVSAAAPGDLNILVKEATAGTGWAGTITVTYNGVVVATKTGTITGAANKITITPVKVGKNDGAATAASLEYQVQDSAGNNLVLPFASLVFGSSSNTAVVSTAAGSVVNTTTAVGNGTFTCLTGATGTSDIVLQTILSNGAAVKSNSVTVKCGGAAASYTASWDKASYAQGDIAKLTISFKDAKGVAANSTDAVSALTNQVITANQTERVTAHVASAVLDVNGQLVYTFTVGTASGAIAGKYQALVSFPTVATGTTQTVGYEIAGATGVTNADVLKAIVSLIASINKQIAALQKALLARR